MGDVLLTLPVLQGISRENQDLAMVLVTQGRFAAYFKEIRNLHIIEFDPQNRHKGFLGLLRLYKELRRYPIEKVIDLHGVWRTYFLDLLYSIGFHRVYRIRKYRGLRRQILKGRKGVKIPHTTKRYLEVFNRAGYYGTIQHQPLEKRGHVKNSHDLFQIGIAPLARHSTKNWSQEHVIALIDKLLTNYKSTIYLFGGLEDQANLEAIKKPSVINIAGTLNPDKEVELIRSLDLFISMDSANMHLAALAGVPTLSVWGATDPAFGFSALGQPDTYSLYTSSPEAFCRPCSVYGAKPCHRTDHPMICMDLVTPGQVYRLAEEILGQRNKI
ncbi:MAG: hypothetical protein A2X22_10490 [Bacteroidetes bacterium GWF2_49_14]|nr:MAG: hypothetical protein A2X22_10490 [Bacteroidetes bacterium GWF2_49_14]